MAVEHFWPKKAQGRLQELPRLPSCSQHVPKRPPDGSRDLPRESKRARDRPKRPPRRPKTPPRPVLDGSRTATKSSKTVPRSRRFVRELPGTRRTSRDPTQTPHNPGFGVVSGIIFARLTLPFSSCPRTLADLNPFPPSTKNTTTHQSPRRSRETRYRQHPKSWRRF